MWANSPGTHHNWFIFAGLVLGMALEALTCSAYDLVVERNNPDSEILLRFHMEPGDWMIQADPETGDASVRIEGCTNIRPAGYPRLPVISHLIRISPTLRPEVSIEPRGIETIRSENAPPPSNGRDEAERGILDEVQEIEADAGIPFESHVRLGNPEILRDLRVVQLSFYPVAYDSSLNTYKVITDALIRIRMDGRDYRNVLTDSRRITSTFDQFYRSVVLNYSPDSRDRTGDPEKYLIYYPDAYESRLQGFIAWKEAEGFEVVQIRKSELPVSASPADLKNLLLAEYTSPNPPVFVLLIGDEYATPIYYTYDPTHPGDFADDLYYSLLAGDDILPDVFLGRLPAEDATETGIMIQKILRYEQNPPMSVPSFYHTGIMAASALEESQIIAKQQTAARLIEFCDYQNMHEYYAWNTGTVGLIIEEINEGVSIINYRGEGWRRGWNPMHEFWFDEDDVYSLHNPNLTPFITSIGCGVNLFFTSDDCFGHAWMAHGTLSTPLGAVGIIGPTWNTHTTYNNWLDRGMYRGYVYWNVCRAAPFMDYGKVYMRDQFPEPEHQTYVDITFQTYLDFGTPDMWIRLGTPSEPYVSLAYDNNSNARYIAVRNGFGELVDNGLVSWSANNDRWALMTDEAGGVPCGFSSVPSNAVDVVVTGENLIPARIVLPWRINTSTGNLIITEIKPDIPTNGTTGDKVEIYNAGLSAVDLREWTITDLDGYDPPFVQGTATLQPQQLAVIELVGPAGTEQITATSYGLLIKSRAIADFSSQEDIAVLRAPNGRVMDALAWHDLSGSCSSNVATDLSKVTAPSSTLNVDTAGWWSGPDTVTQSDYEAYAIDWSPFAGNDGPGSIQRSSIGSPDGPGNFTIQATTGFGSYYHLTMNSAADAGIGESLRNAGE